jgi:hypothetical protein
VVVGAGEETRAGADAARQTTAVDRRPPERTAASSPAWALPAQALAVALATRLALFLVAWIALRIFPRFALYPVQLPDSFFPDDLWLDGWARWDAAHYVAIAGQGYGGDNPSPHGGVGFFPLWPLLMRGAVEAVGAAPTPANLALAGIVLANLCFLAAVVLLTRLAEPRLGAEGARTAALLLCVVPFGFFFNAAYSESLFLVLVLAAFALAGGNRWGAAGAVAGLASASRLVGLALLPALLWLAWRRRASLRDLIGLAVLSPAGAVAYGLYTWRRFDDPFAYFEAQATWGGWDEHVRFYAELFLFHPRQALLGDPRHLIILLNTALGLVALALLPKVWRTCEEGLALFTTLLVVVQFAFTWVSLGRYLLPAAGLYLAAAALLTQPRWSGWARDAVVLVSTVLLATLTVLYTHAFWVV